MRVETITPRFSSSVHFTPLLVLFSQLLQMILVFLSRSTALFYGVCCFCCAIMSQKASLCALRQEFL